MPHQTTTQPKLSVRLFGAPQVTYAQETLTIPRNQVRAMFYRLACERAWIARQHLCFLFWPDVADASARQSLTLTLSHLRRALPVGEMLVTDNANARLAEEFFDSDVVKFEALCLGEHKHIERLKDAVALYRGPFLDGIALDNCPEFENWQSAERNRYERLFLDALSTLIGDAVARGVYAEAIGYAQRYLQVDPLEEEIHRRLIELYVATGNRSAAMQQYEQCVLLLERELGVSPMPETFAVYEAAQHERPNNLPLPPTTLIGRQDEMTQTTNLLRRDDVWLVTLNGPGGSGKTRLALEVATQLLTHFLHGVYFVDLSPIRNPQLVIGTIARALGLQDAGVQPMKDTLCNFLSEKHVLLVLDNFEQVLDAAPHLTDLHAAAPGLKILVTSRAALHLRGEREMSVPPLPVARLTEKGSPHDFLQSDAVRLFVERAQDMRPGFELNASNAVAIAGICASVDGLPLAIELAAARSKLLTPQAILERLTAPLDLLSRGARDLPDRQQTLRATITWSANLLNADERALFRRLGVFRGGFTVDTAAAVCNADDDLDIDVLDGLDALLDHNLIRYAVDHNAVEPRFTMLETIRSFTWDELEVRGELDAARRSHAVFFLKLAEEARPQLRSHRQSEWLRRLTTENDNLTSAMDWMLDSEQSEPAMRLAHALARFWLTTAYLTEGVALLERTLALPDTNKTPNWRARILYAASRIHLLSENPNRAYETASQAVALTSGADNPSDIVQALLALARAQGEQSQDWDAVRSSVWEASRIVKQLPNSIDQADVWVVMSATILQGEWGLNDIRPDKSQGIAYGEQAVSLYTEWGDKINSAVALQVLGTSLMVCGEYDLAVVYSNKALKMFQESDHLNPRVGYSLECLAWIMRVQGNHSGAIGYARECIQFWQRFGIEQSENYVTLANTLQAMGDYTQAIRAYEKAVVLSRRSGNKYMLAETLADYGDAMLFVGNIRLAIDSFRENMLIHRDYLVQGRTLYGDIGTSLVLISELSVAQGDFMRAIRLFGAGETHTAQVIDAKHPIPIADLPDYERTKTFVREQIDSETFDRLYAEGAAMNLTEAVEYALTGLD